MKCGECGDEHDLLEPAFRRPDVVVSMSDAARSALVDEDSDLCRVRVADSWWRRLLGRVEHRYFLRGVLPVSLSDAEDFTQWGLWAEVGEDSMRRVRALWADPNQADEPSFPGTVANNVPGYAPTIGLPLRIQLRNPPLRAGLSFVSGVDHPFATECGAGVSTHRVVEWLRDMGVTV